MQNTPLHAWISESLYEEFAREQTTAHRLFTAPGAWVERLGDDVLISYKNDPARDEAFEALQAWEKKVGCHSRRVFSRFLPKQNNERLAPVHIQGDPSLPLETVVHERGVAFGLDFAAGYAAGLFIDQRLNRTLVRGLNLPGKKVLNTFAYTCSFSVVAALAGAETLSLDLSKKSLDRGKHNFALNGLSTSGHRFLADDVLAVIPRLGKRGEKFDVIILDPPTFSLGHQGRRWRVEEQMEDLLQSVMDLANPGAHILVSTNCTKLDRLALERMARFVLKRSRAQATLLPAPTLPDFPLHEGASTLWMNLR